MCITLHAKHVRILHTPKSVFSDISTTSILFYLAILFYTHFLSPCSNDHDYDFSSVHVYHHVFSLSGFKFAFMVVHCTLFMYLFLYL